MRYLAIAALTLLPTIALAQGAPPPKPSQALAGQLATALAQAQDRIADLEAQLQAMQAQAAKATPAPAAPATLK